MTKLANNLELEQGKATNLLEGLDHSVRDAVGVFFVQQLREACLKANEAVGQLKLCSETKEVPTETGTFGPFLDEHQHTMGKLKAAHASVRSAAENAKAMLK